MAISGEALDIIIRLQGLRVFQSEMGQAQTSVRGFTAATKEATVASDVTGKSMARNAGLMGLVKRASLGLGIAVGAALLDGYKMSVQFQQQMELVHTQAGASQREVDNLKSSVLAMAPATGIGPLKLADALYHIESVGYRGKTALTMLRAAANGAAVGLADAAETASTLAGVMKVGMPGAARDSTVLMGQLNATVGAGNMKLADLNHAMGVGILPVAKNYGLQLRDITGALAVFTDEHMQGSSAMAQLATALHFLTGATSTGEKALESIGLKGKTLANDMRGPSGLHHALTDLHDHLQRFSRDPTNQMMVLQHILPGGRGRILQVLMNQLDNYQTKMHQIDSTTKNFADSISKTHETSAYKIKAAWAGVQSQLIILGDTVRPILTVIFVGGLIVIKAFLAALIWMVNAIKELIEIYKKLPAPIRLVITALALMTGAIIAFLLISRGIALVTTMWRVLAAAVDLARVAMILFVMDNPVLLMLAALIAILILAVTHWEQLKRGAVRTWNDIKNITNTVVNGIIDDINLVIKAIDRLIQLYNDIPGVLRPTGKIGLIGQIGYVGDGSGYKNTGLGSGFNAHPQVVAGPAGSSALTTGNYKSLAQPRSHTPGPGPAGPVALQASVPPVLHSTIVMPDGQVLAKVVSKATADKKART